MRALIITLLLFYMIVYFHRVMTGVMKVEIDYVALLYGINPDVLLALLSSSYFYSYTLAQLFVGTLTDAFGIKRVGALFAVIMGAGALLMSLMSPVTLILGRVLVGFSATAAFLAYQRASSLAYSREHQGRLTSYLFVLGNLSTLIATYPLRVALNTVGSKTTLLALATLTFATAACVFTLSKDHGSGGRVNGLRDTVRYLKVLIKDPHIWGLGVASLGIYGVTLAYQSSWGQKHLSEVFGMSIDVASQYLMLLALIFTLTTPIAGFLSDKVLRRRKPLLLAASATSALSWTLMLYSTLTLSTTTMFTSLVLLGVAAGLHTVAPPMAKESYAVGYSATAIALFNTILFSGTAVLQTVASIINPCSSIIIHLAASLVGAFLAVTQTRETLR